MSIKKITTIMLSMLILATPVQLMAYDQSSGNESKPELIVEVYLNNNDLNYIENIELDDGTKVKDYDYEITYVQTNSISRSGLQLSQYFDYVGWITRDGMISLSLDPNSSVRGNYNTAMNAWGCLASPTVGVASSSYWPSNSQCLKWQYICHYYIANWKDYWNIEPARTSSSYANVLNYNCNP